MITYIDCDDTLWNGNYITDHIFGVMSGYEQGIAKELYKNYRLDCVEAVKYAKSVNELVEAIGKAEKAYIIEGARLLRDRPEEIMTKKWIIVAASRLPPKNGPLKPNDHILSVARHAMGNGGLVLMSAEDERVVDSFTAEFGLMSCKKVCSRLSENRGKLTGEFEKIVGVKEKQKNYMGGTVYENGINGIGIINEAVATHNIVNICGNDPILLMALDRFDLKEKVNFLD